MNGIKEELLKNFVGYYSVTLDEENVSTIIQIVIETKKAQFFAENLTEH